MNVEELFGRNIENRLQDGSRGVGVKCIDAGKFRIG